MSDEETTTEVGKREAELAAQPNQAEGVEGVASATPTGLTEREQDVIRLLADGRDTAEIATTLCYSERTVKGVIHDVTSRLQLRNRSHVVAFALRNGMI